MISFATVEKKVLNPFAISDDSVTDTPLIFISDISADLDDLRFILSFKNFQVALGSF